MKMNAPILAGLSVVALFCGCESVKPESDKLRSLLFGNKAGLQC